MKTPEGTPDKLAQASEIAAPVAQETTRRRPYAHPAIEQTGTLEAVTLGTGATSTPVRCP